MSNELVQTGFFDLELDAPQKTWHIGLEDGLQDTLRQRAAKIKAVVAQANFIIGEELATAQQELTYKNGGFVKWLEEEVGIDHERAYEFIRIWEGYKMLALSANISGIGKKVLLKSSRDDIPESARQEIVTRHTSGEKITMAVSDEIIERHKAEAEAAKQQAEELEKANQDLQGRLFTSEEEVRQAKEEVQRSDEMRVAVESRMWEVMAELGKIQTEFHERPIIEKIVKETIEVPVVSQEAQVRLALLEKEYTNLEAEKKTMQDQLKEKEAKIQEKMHHIASLAEQNEQLSEEIHVRFTERRVQVEHERIKQRWDQDNELIYMNVNSFIEKVPSPLSRECFANEQRARALQTVEIFEKAIAVLKSVAYDIHAHPTIIDANARVESGAWQ